VATIVSPRYADHRDCPACPKQRQAASSAQTMRYRRT